jgi:hypothetical protein
VSRLGAALLLGAIYVAFVVYGVLTVVLTSPPPPRVPLPTAGPALTEHVLFVVVDGLRYDIATDPARMPHFAEAMRTRRSAEIYAGRISTTAAAVQSYGTGQRGRVGLIVRNINPGRAIYNSWIENAAQRGLTLGLVGDHVWDDMYGKSLHHQRHNPPGVAMDVDYTDQMLGYAREMLAKRPNLVIAHFVTTDNLGHVHGIQSPRYREFIHGFDRKLFELLADVPEDWTVIVTSDHGATDSGMHGADAKIQRRSPIFAYGPGIAPKQAPETLGQQDVAGTLAALLGVPAAVHSTGHLLTDWLDVPPETRARYACSDAERALRLSRAEALTRTSQLEARLTAACAATRPLELQKSESRAVVAEVDRELASVQDISSRSAWVFMVVTLLGAALVGWLLVGHSLALAGVCGAMGLVAIAMVATIDRLPGAWPKGVDAALFTVLNVPSLLFWFAPERFFSLLSARPRLAAAVVPGAFAVTYPTNLQPVAYALCFVAPLTIALSATSRQWGGWWKWRRDELWSRLVDLVFILGWAAALGPGGIPSADAASMIQHEQRTLAWAFGLLATGLWVLVRRRPRAGRLFAAFLALVFASLLLRRIAPPWLGRPMMLGLPIAGAVLVWRRQLELGVACLLAGFMWVSRDFEVISVAGGFGVAVLLGERLALLPVERWNHGRMLTVCGLLFCVMFLVRIGVSNGLNPIGMDFGAGAFGDKNVSATWIAFSLIWKYAVIAACLMVVFLRGAPRAVTSQVLLLIVTIGVCRAAVLLGMMQCAPGSVWVLMRVLSDLPFALLFAVTAALLLPWGRQKALAAG